MTLETTHLRAGRDAGEQAPGLARGRVVAWALVAAAAVGVALWFALPSDEAPAAPERGGGARAVPVSAVPVERGALAERAIWPGELDADAADIPSLVIGRLKAVHVRVGDRVEVDQLLAEVDTVELEAQLEAARAGVHASGAAQRRAAVDLSAARREQKRAEELDRKGLVSDQQLEARRSEVEAATAAVRVAEAQVAEARASVEVLSRRLAQSEIRAPFAGVVTTRHVDPGAFVLNGTSVARVVASGPLRVIFEVPAESIAQLRRSATFAVRSAATGELEVAGRLTGVAGEVQRDRRVVRAEGVIDGAPADWLSGMFAEVLLVKRAAEDAVITPVSALVRRVGPGGEELAGVFVAEGDVARWVPATVLARDGQRMAIEGEIPAGAWILVGGHTDLIDGAPILLERGDGAPPAPDAGGAPTGGLRGTSR